MTLPQPVRRRTPEEYLRRELNAVQKRGVPTRAPGHQGGAPRRRVDLPSADAGDLIADEQEHSDEDDPFRWSENGNGHGGTRSRVNWGRYLQVNECHGTLLRNLTLALAR